MLNIDAEVFFRKVPDMPEAGFYSVILPKEPLNGFSFCRRLNNHKISGHFSRLGKTLKTGHKSKTITDSNHFWPSSPQNEKTLSLFFLPLCALPTLIREPGKSNRDRG